MYEIVLCRSSSFSRQCVFNYRLAGCDVTNAESSFKQYQCFGETCCFSVRYRKCMYLRSSKPKNAVTGSSEPLLLAHQTTRRNISEECNVHGRFATRRYEFRSARPGRMDTVSCCSQQSQKIKQPACGSVVSFRYRCSFFLWHLFVA
jgi:hypothetical protein